jgi:drug/metabolite transporter (DMT)-like permease
VVTIAARALLGERITRAQWAGIGLGIGGVAVVVAERLTANAVGISAATLAASAVSVVGMCGGTLVQRRHGREMPLLWGTVVQYSASAVVLAVGAAAMGWRFDVTQQSVLALGWAVVVLSLGAVLLMLWLLQRKAAAQVSSLFFLTPALSTVEGAVLFGERLSPAAVVALVVALCGVALTMRSGAD